MAPVGHRREKGQVKEREVTKENEERWLTIFMED